jgi:hypothetical protein
MQGARSAFHLPARQAILRVASRRIRSDFLSRRRAGEAAGGVLGCTSQQACPVLDAGKDEGNAADGCFSAACLTKKRPETSPPAFSHPKKSGLSFLFSDEPFNVLLRTNTKIRRSSNELHGETSISWTSPPFLTYILSIHLPSCQEK